MGAVALPELLAGDRFHLWSVAVAWETKQIAHATSVMSLSVRVISCHGGKKNKWEFKCPKTQSHAQRGVEDFTGIRKTHLNLITLFLQITDTLKK